MDQVLLKNKTKLIRWLKLDGFLLQHVQEKELITTTEYETIKYINVPTEAVIQLLDIIHGKGENVCRLFLNLLKNDEVNEFSPELREWIKTVGTSETANTEGQSGIQITNYQKFLKTNTSLLVQKVKNVDAIIDELDWHDELIANVKAQPTRQKKMRELLDCVNCESIAKDLVNALFKHEERAFLSELQL
ncbi:apoptosis-associated speck-like protein containing a CARD [Pimephales promelas]|nr:apoptosis-associated speck-like protein containing a CARD [Pimephales promelas]